MYLKMHRSDHAEKQLRIMQQIDDHTLTQLASSWLNLAVDFAKSYQETSMTFKTSMTLNGKAICCMHMGQFSEAGPLLPEAMNKKLLQTLLFVVFILGNHHHDSLGDRLKVSHPEHVVIKCMTAAVQNFDRALQVVA
ncbi:Coatomer subunit epsilon-1 [Nymphaea thermarum]|nr:Coatomer subunit epsilon-1 [Nymphaea thermarum]